MDGLSDVPLECRGQQNFSFSSVVHARCALMREQVEEEGGWHAVAQVACVAYVVHAVAYAGQALLHEPESSGEKKQLSADELEYICSKL